jgi:hypothetical protein
VSWRLALATIAFCAIIALWVYLMIEIPDCGTRENFEDCVSAKQKEIAKLLASAALLYGAGLYGRHRYRNA